MAEEKVGWVARGRNGWIGRLSGAPRIFQAAELEEYLSAYDVGEVQVFEVFTRPSTREALRGV